MTHDHVLMLDTSTDYAIVGICDSRGNVLSSQVQMHERQLSVRMYSMIEQALRDANIEKSQIDALSVGLGPGSFTGVRVGVTTMRTLAQALTKPLYAFGTLDATAQTAWFTDLKLATLPTLALLPSRKNELYTKWFNNYNDLESAAANSYESAVKQFENMGENAIVVGPSVVINGLFPGLVSNKSVTVEYPSVAALAFLTAQSISTGDASDPLSLDPMYVALPALSQHKSTSNRS